MGDEVEVGLGRDQVGWSEVVCLKAFYLAVRLGRRAILVFLSLFRSFSVLVKIAISLQAQDVSFLFLALIHPLRSSSLICSDV